MNADYSSAIEAEREAWVNLVRASDNALMAWLIVDWTDRTTAERAEAEWLSRLAAVREGIARRRWLAASERLAEACARFGAV